ncbi:NAD(P)H-hydrate dehydratase [Oleiharenicola lentus]|uniref:NAD(P)H-hydrate dehydratase n=1 Tax=Oleiharenicola lentus TaxID=2508720 RepID=UPI003F6643FB
MAPLTSQPVLTGEEAKKWEASLLKFSAAEWKAMQRAGAAIAEAVKEDFKEIGGLPQNARVLVLAGKGHNGGDAILAAREILRVLPQARADVLLLFPVKKFRPLAKRSWQALRTLGAKRVKSVKLSEATKVNYAVCFDGGFGFQFRAPMDLATAAVLSEVNAHPAIQLRAAVDLPSGISEARARTAFRADFTYATGIVKAPVLAEMNSKWVGRVRFLELGFFAQHAPAATSRVLTPALLAPLAKLRSSQTDKRKFGHVFVVGGSLSFPGAVVLAVRAALRSGAGLVTAFVPEKLVAHYAAEHPEVMWVGCPVGKTGGLNGKTLPLVRARIKRANALLIGPGLGAAPETIALAGKLVALSHVPVVLDADALRPEVVKNFKEKPFVCTPHAGEFQRIEHELKKHAQAVVILKGPLSRVLSGRETYFSLQGGPVLARGGSGDILAGLTGGLLAQTPGYPLLAACRAVTWHGLAADLLARARGQVAVETSQLLEQLGPALVSTHVPITD